MTGKRPAPSNEASGSTAKAAKKQKTRDARTIHVQNAPSESSRGPAVRFTSDSLTGLPGSIDVEKFAEARSFEIDAMQQAMQVARNDASKRVWQTLPRHLRRRTASHDVRRVPLRLRVKARAEMDSVKRKKKTKALAKRGKGAEIGRTAKLLKRQRDKTWLETHIWHAKRMKMDNLWGYRLALHPTEKSFRPSHRAAVHGCILQDVSYFGTLELKGPQSLLKRILSQCCDPQIPFGSSRYTSGARICETHIHQSGAYPFDLIAPCTILWKPVKEDEASPKAPSDKNKGKQKEPVTTTTTTARTIWIRCHPSAFDVMHRTIVESASAVFKSISTLPNASPPDMDVDTAPSQPQSQEPEIEIADLRNAINAFELTGPKANQVLAGAFKLTKEVGKEARKMWNALRDVRSTASVPRGLVLGLKVHDPRLSFPPVNETLKEQTDLPSTKAPFTLAPSADAARSELWDEESREVLKKPKYKKKDLDQRRSKNLVPGTRLRPIQDDNRVDTILIQRTIAPSQQLTSNTGTGASRSKNTNTTALHGWTLLLPSGWSMPFLSTLLHTGSRAGGLREHQTQHFEASVPHFPRDYPTTPAYGEGFWEKRGQEERAKWERTPKAKRVPFGERGVRSPWGADWDVVLGLRKAENEEADDGGEGGENMIPTQPGMEDLLEAMLGEGSAETPAPPNTDPPAKSDAPIRSWLLYGHDIQALVTSMASQGDDRSSAHLLLTRINVLREKKGLGPTNASAEALLQGCLVSVRVKMCGRGVVGDLGMIYAPDDLSGEAEDKWREEAGRAMKGKGTEVTAETGRRLGRGIGAEDKEEVDEDDESEKSLDATPDASSIIGYVTSGHFSLQIGKGYGLGAVALGRLVELARKDIKARRKTLLNLVKVRSREAVFCRAACLEVSSP